MAKGRLAPPQGAELGDLVITDGARGQLRELDAGVTARIALSGEISAVCHGSHRATARRRRP